MCSESVSGHIALFYSLSNNNKLMKYLKYWFAILIGVLCISITACSSDDDDDDDDDDKPEITLGTIGGTSWKVTSATYDEMVGTAVTFNKDMTMTFTPEYRGAIHAYRTNGSTLTIDFTHYGYIEGPCTISGKTCKYTYHWYDTDGSIEDGGKTYQITLTLK